MNRNVNKIKRNPAVLYFYRLKTISRHVGYVTFVIIWIEVKQENYLLTIYVYFVFEVLCCQVLYRRQDLLKEISFQSLLQSGYETEVARRLFLIFFPNSCRSW